MALITEQDLSADQKEVYDSVVKWLDDKSDLILKVGGFAGTGKTTILSLLAKKFGENAAFCCFTGKAANVLRTKLNEQKIDYSYCGTIHGLIYRPIVNKRTLEVMGWARKSNLDESFIIIDEASMVGGKMWADLNSFGVKILCFGDHAQLPPINSFINLMDKPDIKLEKIHRQAEDNPIIKISMLARQGKDITDFKTDDDRIAFLSKYDYSRIEKFFAKMYINRDPMESAALGYFNTTRNRNNNIIRGLCGKGAEPEENDLVICLKNVNKNDYSIFNGMRGIIKSCIKDSKHLYYMDINFPYESINIEDKICVHQFNKPYTYSNILEFKSLGFSPKKWGDVGLLFDFGYALTVHKAQGSQFENVMVFVERMKNDDDDEFFYKWLYTAITRSSVNLAIVV